MAGCSGGEDSGLPPLEASVIIAEKHNLFLFLSGGEAHPQEQAEADLHGPAGQGRDRQPGRGIRSVQQEGGQEAGLLPLLEHARHPIQVTPLLLPCHAGLVQAL